MKTDKYYQFSIMVIVLLLLSSCASPYLGMRVNTSADFVCNFDKFPASCTMPMGDLSLDYTIEETGKAGEYKVSGSALWIGGDSWISYDGALFTLLLINQDTIVETVDIAGGGGNLDIKMKFSRTFTTPNRFKASILSWSIERIQG